MEHRVRNAAAPACPAEWVAEPPLRHRAHGGMAAVDRPVVPAGSISVLGAGDEQMLRLAGEVDAATVDAFDESAFDESAFDESPAGPHGRRGTKTFTLVDVSEVTFIDCFGLRFILRHTEATAQRSTRPVLLQPPAAVRRILELTGLSSLFDLEG